MRSGSNMLDAGRRDSWFDLPQATQAAAATRVIHSVENSAYQLADTLQAPTGNKPVIEVEVNLGQCLRLFVFNKIKNRANTPAQIKSGLQNLEIFIVISLRCFE